MWASEAAFGRSLELMHLSCQLAEVIMSREVRNGLVKFAICCVSIFVNTETASGLSLGDMWQFRAGSVFSGYVLGWLTEVTVVKSGAWLFIPIIDE